MTKIKLAIIGSRDFDDADLFERTLEPYRNKISLVISGGARGADSLAEEWAEVYGIPTKIFKADWSKGKGAGFARNIEIIGACDAVIAFWDGNSPGTAHSLRLAKDSKKPVKVINV
jgi:predicted Rossmann fold nucleotide-binding protein DprA/Smf involved in DNA uptake